MDFERLKQLSELNTQLLEIIIWILHYLDGYCEKLKIPTPYEERFLHLIRRAIEIIEEINGEISLPPKWKHRFRTPPDSTEPEE
jgi:hypothetical protein